MKCYFLSALALSSLMYVGSVSAETAPVASRTLLCSNKGGSVSVGICGVKGCVATVKTNGPGINYLMNRLKNKDGSLTYMTRPGVTPRCTLVIDPLKNGSRPVKTLSCARAVQGAACKINVDAPSGTSTPAPK